MAQSLEKAASKNTANTALGLAIGALGVELLGGAFGGGLFGRGLFGGPCNEGFERGFEHGGCGRHWGHEWGCPSTFDVYAKENHDALALTCKDYEGVIMGLNNRFQDRQYVDFGFFNLEKEILHDKLIASEKDCKLQNEITALRGHIEKIEAIRPYQDKLIQHEINDARKEARWDVCWATRYMINGELVLPSTPTVTGFPSATATPYIPTEIPSIP